MRNPWRIRLCPHPWYHFEFLDPVAPCCECARVVRPVFINLMALTVILGCAMLAAIVAGCAPGFDSGRQVLTNSAVVVATGAQTVRNVDAVRKDEIKREAGETCTARFRSSPSLDVEVCVVEEGERLFGEYKAKRGIAMKAVQAAQVALQTASDLLPLVEAGVRAAKDFWAAVAALAPAVSILTQAVVDIAIIGRK